MPHVFVSCFLLIWAVVAMAKKSRADYSPAPLSMSKRVREDYTDKDKTSCGRGCLQQMRSDLRAALTAICNLYEEYALASVGGSSYANELTSIVEAPFLL